jgi:hypothetical protein
VTLLRVYHFVFDHSEHSRLLKKLLYVYSTEVKRFTNVRFCFPHIIVLVNLLKILVTSFLL